MWCIKQACVDIVALQISLQPLDSDIFGPVSGNRKIGQIGDEYCCAQIRHHHLGLRYEAKKVSAACSAQVYANNDW
jgi:hypothetical protein